jgi:RNA polymerase sigma factor (sigma-70 family)
MHQQLTNLSDKELISLARKQKNREAEGILMDRYSHLLVAVSLPHVSGNPEANVNPLYPTLLQQLSSSLKTQTIYKVNEWLHYVINGNFNNADKTIPFYPSRDTRDLLHIENKVIKTSSNPIEREEMVLQLQQAIGRLGAEEQELITKFYLENQSFSTIAAEKGYTTEKVRQQLKIAKHKLATQFMHQTYAKQ